MQPGGTEGPSPPENCGGRPSRVQGAPWPQGTPILTPPQRPWLPFQALSPPTQGHKLPEEFPRLLPRTPGSPRRETLARPRERPLYGSRALTSRYPRPRPHGEEPTRGYGAEVRQRLIASPLRSPLSQPGSSQQLQPSPTSLQRLHRGPCAPEIPPVLSGPRIPAPLSTPSGTHSAAGNRWPLPRLSGE